MKRFIFSILTMLLPLAVMGQSVSRTELLATNTSLRTNIQARLPSLNPIGTNPVFYGPLQMVNSGTNQFSSTAFTNLSPGFATLGANGILGSSTAPLTNNHMALVNFLGNVFSPYYGSSFGAGGVVGVSHAAFFADAPTSYSNSISHVFSGTEIDDRMNFNMTRANVVRTVLSMRADGVLLPYSSMIIPTNLVVGGSAEPGSSAPLSVFGPTTAQTRIILGSIGTTATFTNAVVSKISGVSDAANSVSLFVNPASGTGGKEVVSGRGDGVTETFAAIELGNSTTTPTAAAIGAGRARLQISNGVFYVFSTTDGSSLTTTKIAP